METINKISATEYEKVTPQPDVVQTLSLDSLLATKESIMSGIQGNKDAITFQMTKLDEINAEIEKVRNLGVQTSSEVQVAVEAELQTATVEPLPIEEIIK